MVDWLVSTLEEDDPKIKLLALFPRVSVPAPLRVTFAAPMSSSVAFPVEFIVIVPALLTVLPLTVKTSALAIARLSVPVPSVRVLVASFPLIVTAELAALIHVLEALVGTPTGVQLPATSQLPVPPFQVEVHCASAETGSKSSVTATSQSTRQRGLLPIESYSREKKRERNSDAIMVALPIGFAGVFPVRNFN